ncbi:hypothetical protein [Pseudomonas fluorescens]|uniref:Uncharacterized protein n=1 Tax=Pseudomonas fluorescens TaxID=294 RepID=A0A5E7V026_PSEFL|nr:hypothetical protein [Pseudomonas fluorescens]VVQ15646.1 hypothetical protein PS928_04288 [Pseudomonas fluorescens]
MLPLLDALESRWRGQFGARLYHNNRQQDGAPLLLINLCGRPMELGLWLTAWLASSAGSAVDVFDWPLPPTELAMAIEYIQPKALLVYSSQALNSTHWPRLQTGYAGPCLIIDPAAHIHHQALQTQARQNGEPDLAQDPLTALQILADLNLLESP